MDKNYLLDLYFNWMCSVAFPNEHIRSHYSNALRVLNKIDFTYLIELDENRMLDGINLRYHFSYGTKLPYDYVSEELQNIPCSVLEMMIALALRCENAIMSNSEYGDRTSEWFWRMFSNLGLDKYPDSVWNAYVERTVVDIIVRFLNRDYYPDGTGSLFKFNNPIFDMRTVEIWDQMCLYINELVKNDSRI